MYLAGFIVAGFLVASVYAFALAARAARPPPPRRPRRGAQLRRAGRAGAAAGRATGRRARSPSASRSSSPRSRGSRRRRRARRFELAGGIEIPKLLSLLAFHDPNATVQGLDSVPEDDRPPTGIVKLSFRTMVAIGSGAGRARRVVHLGLVAARPAARARPGSTARSWRPGRCRVVALIAGWVTTEVGRQPWVVYEVMRTEEAVTGASGIPVGFAALGLVYVGAGRDRVRDAAPARAQREAVPDAA